MYVSAGAHPNWGGAGGGLLPDCSPPKSKNKNQFFLEAMISNFYIDLHFSRNQPLISADNWYTGK